jgi:hypothetical protein
VSHDFQQNFCNSYFRRPPHRAIVHQLTAKRGAVTYRGNSSGSTIRCLLATWWESITHQPTAAIFCMTPILVAVLVEARHLGREHTILTSRELMWCYACSWDVRGDLTLNFMAQIHASVTLLTSRDLTWSSGRLTCQHASHISVVAHISW